MKIHLSKQSESGMSLTEVVMATAIIAMLAGSVVSAINYGLMVMRIARENQRATQVMVERLESIRLYNWDQVRTNNFIPTSFTESYDPSNTNAQGITFYGQLSIANPSFSGGSTPTYAPDMRQFTVTLQWTNASQIAHTRSITTYIAKDGIQNYVY
jgi:prepilin-type N-terminal cleavage/methylation domain-containing protein